MNDVLKFCVDFGNSSWFGGAEVGLQKWPLNKLNWTDREYVTTELHSQAVSIVIIIIAFIANSYNLVFGINYK